MATKLRRPAAGIERKTVPPDYDEVLRDVSALLEGGRRAAAQSINSVMTTTYWMIGRRIVEGEQRGKRHAAYGEALLKRLGADLTARFGRGFGWRNLFQMRSFYLAYADILQTASAISEANELSPKLQTASAISVVERASPRFPLPWSHYVKLSSVKNGNARAFYESEALRGGWTFRQLVRQIDSQFYERTALSRNKAATLHKGAVAKPEDATSPEEEIKDPFVLEFLALKDEYSESDLEEAIIHQLETFLLELGGDFTFIGRQRRLRVGDEWYRIDLLFFHRRLRCLVVIDLKLGNLTPGDAGQMHMYLNYAREHWTLPSENPPVGLILCAGKHDAVAHYALEGLPNKVLAAEYKTALPSEDALVEQVRRSTRMLTASSRPPS